MDAVCVGYPAIAKARQLCAKRLGVRDSEHEHANRWDINRPVQQRCGDDGGAVQTQRAEGRRKELQHLAAGNEAAAMRPSPFPGHRSPVAPATATRRGGNGDCCARRDKSVSPLPPRHDRSAQRTPLRRERSTQRTGLVDTAQILRGVRAEAAALDRFLSLEVEPAAQQILEAAALDHARARRFLMGPPADAADALGADPVSSSNSSTPTTATNSNDDDDDDNDNSRGFTAAAKNQTPPPPPPPGVAGALSKARRRAVKAQVIKLQPPPEFGLRASLPARAGAGADAAAAGAFGRRASTAFVVHDAGAAAGAGAGAGVSSDSSRWSLPGRHFRTRATAENSGGDKQAGGGGAGMGRTVALPQGAGDLAATPAGSGRAADGAGVGGKREAVARADADDASRGIWVNTGEEEEEEEDGEWEWEVPLPDGKLAADISSKMVGLSSLIRRKAAAAAAEAGRNDGRRKQ